MTSSRLKALGKELGDAAGCSVAVALLFPRFVELYAACRKLCDEEAGSLTDIREILSAVEALMIGRGIRTKASDG